MSLFDAVDPNLAEVERMLKKLDVNALTPIEALLKLSELKSCCNNEDERSLFT